MRAGYLSALDRALRLLWREPLLWAPAVLLDGPLLLLALAVARGLVSDASALSEVEHGRALIRAAILLPILWLLSMLAHAAWLEAADAVLRDGRARLGDLAAGLRRWSLRLVVARALLWLGGLAASLLWLVLLIALLTGWSAESFRALGRGAGFVSTAVAAWSERGVTWLVGMVVLLALTGAVREMIRLAGLLWRPAMVAERSGLWPAAASSVRFAYGRGWTLLGRSVMRFLVQAAALLGPTLAWAGPLGRLSGGKVPERLTELLSPAVTGLWLLSLVVAWLLARSWLSVADLVWYRAAGGADGDPRLATRGVRTPRRRQPRARQAGLLQVASEPVRGEDDRWHASAMSES